jgi:hypothetical protein
MRRPLVIHPDFACPAVRGLAVEVSRPASGALALTYELTGDLAALYLPATLAPARTDELWKRTCFEAFVAGADGYAEFNFAPTTQWAAYRFGGYRDGMAPLDMPPPTITPIRDGDTYRLTVATSVVIAGSWRVGVSAVIEDAAGERSYWALAHPAGKPDFHHQDGFVLELAEPR